MKLSDKIKDFKKELLDELQGKVYKISKEAIEGVKKGNPAYNCDCSFTFEEDETEDQKRVAVTEISIKLRPFQVCHWCKDQMRRPIGQLGSVIAAIEAGSLEVEPMDTVKKVGK